ncbi:MAG: hypothetical protein RR603_03025 [Kurthia sp.]
MNKNQKIVSEWIIQNTFQDAIVELDSAMESVPSEVCDAYYELSEKEQLEALHEALKIHILKMD